MAKWNANTLPVYGCPICIGEGSVHGDKCVNCNGVGTFPAKRNKGVSVLTINEKITNTKQDVNTN